MNTTPDDKKTYRVLMVDDDLTTRLLLRQTLERASFEVIEFDNGRAAVDWCQEHTPDIILLDVDMPGMDGFITCALIKQMRHCRQIPVIMVTGLDDVTSVNYAFDIGASDFVTKPINWTILAHRVRYVLRSSLAFQDLTISKTRLANAQRIANIGNWEWDIARDQFYWSEQIYRLLGIQPQNFSGTYAAFLACVHPDDRDAVAGAIERTRLGLGNIGLEHRIVADNGRTKHVQLSAEATMDDAGRVILLEGTLQDITERKQAEETIRHLAYYDTLTRLPNRQLFLDRLNQSLLYAKRHDKPMAVVSIGLDRFKEINESLGHSIGDALLQEISKRLGDAVRETDSIGRAALDENDLARFSGDQFSILLTGISKIEDAAAVARRILGAISATYTIAGHEIYATASIGIAGYPTDGDTTEALVKNADTAMYHAKRDGGNQYQFFTAAMNDKAVKRHSMESKLRKAIERDELVLFYQPKVDVATLRIIGAEALIRWKSAELGMVSPLDFIPLAEETGLIVPIGEWVIHTATDQIKQIMQAGLDPIGIAVNLSSQQFRHSDLNAVVEHALQLHGVAPKWLELEITESVVMQDTDKTMATLRAFKDMGLGLAMDDFGTGYSSLSYLKRFPIDTLKIDRSFIRDIHADADDAAITSAIIAMAHKLKLTVVAEGVETAEHLELLRQFNCNYMQGFYFSKPLPPADFMALLKK